jgi:hypothetical protein
MIEGWMVPSGHVRFFQAETSVARVIPEALFIALIGKSIHASQITVLSEYSQQIKSPLTYKYFELCILERLKATSFTDF